MRVAAFMSGSGTNIVKLFERQKRLNTERGASPFQVIFIFSDRSDGSCQGEKIAYQNGIPYFSYDIRTFHRLRGLTRRVDIPEGLAARRDFDSLAKRLVKAFDVDVIALGGYIILSPDGKRKYVGDHAVLDAISTGETTLRSSTLWTDQGVDTGPLLMVSDPLKVELPEPLDALLKDRGRLLSLVQEHQERLKEGDDCRRPLCPGRDERRLCGWSSRAGGFQGIGETWRFFTSFCVLR
jgi:folate-dependent phosphoribosylglycinamide formyltransferase PurN